MTAYPRPQRVEYGRDRDGAMLRIKRYDEIVPLVIDWSDLLGGTTISSVAYVDGGVTRTNTSNTTTTTTTHVAGTGTTEITLTLANGDKLQKVVRFSEDDSSNDVSDYD